MTVWILATLLVGCRQSRPGNYWKAREACDLADGEFYWQDDIWKVLPSEEPGSEELISYHRPAYPMRAECLGRIAEDLGVEWDDWSAQPEDVFEYVPLHNMSGVDDALVGMWTILALDLGTIGEEWTRTDRPPAFSAEVERYLRTTRLTEDDPLTAAIYMFITETVRETRGSDYSAAFVPSSRTLLWSRSPPGSAAGTFEAVLMMHEAGHRFSLHKTDCMEFQEDIYGYGHDWSCDADADGAYGLAGWLSYRMWLHAQLLIAQHDAVVAAGGDTETEVIGYNNGYGERSHLEDGCIKVKDLSTMDYCFDPEVLEWAGFDLSLRK